MRTRAQPAAERFWTAIAEGRFELPRCGVCSAWQEPDTKLCERCGSPMLLSETAPAGGVVFGTMEPLADAAQGAHTIVIVDMDAGPSLQYPEQNGSRSLRNPPAKEWTNS